jgi:hypothetical protein
MQYVHCFGHSRCVDDSIDSGVIYTARISSTPLPMLGIDLKLVG